MTTKRNIHHASVLNSNENQPWRHKFGLQKDNLCQEFFLIPIPALSMQFNSFSSFVTLQVDYETDADVSFPIPIDDVEYKARLFVLNEASKESHLMAEYHIILKSDGRLSSGESSIIFYRFDTFAQSVTYSLRTSTVECSVKP